MTSRVYINIEADSAVEARDQMAIMLRGHPAVEASAQPLDFNDSVREQPPVDPVAMTEVGEKIAQTQADAPKPTRERGKPAPGHKRRTNAEIAEDEAAAAAPTIATMVTLPDDATSEQVADAFANIKAGISTGEERVGPEDDEATQAADAADEAAETAAAKTDDKPTLEDIRTVLGNYVKVYGTPACMEDGPTVLQEVCGDGVTKVTRVPEDKIADVIAALKAAGKTNRFKRVAVAS